jgi:hypothetical protein
MAKRQEPYKTRLSKRDITILIELYQLQAIRARDIVDAHYGGKEYGFQRLQRVCDKGYIERTFTVRDNGQRYRSVYSITDKGVEELLKTEVIKQERRARDLKLMTGEMLERIDVSKVAINLEKAGWEILGSRDAKPLLGLPTNSIMQCFFTSPKPEDEKYRVYLMGNTIKENTLTKLYTELAESKSASIVLYKTEEIREETPAYQDFVKKITEERILPSQLCLLPLVEFAEKGSEERKNFVINAMLYGGQTQLEQYLRSKYGVIRYSDNRYHFGNVIIEQEGEEYYVCNYLRRDRVALKMLVEGFTIDDHRSTGKKVVVVTWKGYVDEVRSAIDSYQKRDFIQVKGITVQDIIDSQQDNVKKGA